jgi:predicted phage terminase large subunit-like protein
MQNVILELESNAGLREAFGPAIGAAYDFKGQLVKWTDRRIVLRNGATVEAVSPGMAIRGRRRGAQRPALIIVDDLQRDRDLWTADQREKMFRWAVDTLIPALPSGGKGSVVFVDTNKHDDSVSTRLSRMPAWRFIRFPAEVDGRPTWLTREELDAVRDEVGPVSYAKEYLLDPVDPSIQVFRWAEFHRFPRGTFRLGYESEGARQMSWHVGADRLSRLVIALDPSSGFDKSKPRVGTGDCDFAAIVVAGRGTMKLPNGDVRRYVLRVELLRDSPTDGRDIADRQVAALAQLANIYQPSEIVIESVNFQRLLIGNLKRAMADYGDTSIRVVGQGQTVRKESRIESLVADIVGGRLLFADDLPAEYGGQWDDFRRDGTAGHDDGPDATEIAVRALAKRDVVFHVGPNASVRPDMGVDA